MTFNKETFKQNLVAQLKKQYSKEIENATTHQIYEACATTLQEFSMDNWMKTRKAQQGKGIRSVSYLSAEFLMGRAFGNNVINTLVKDCVSDALKDFGIDYNLIENEEPDAGLGNGGLGRLAACFLDSLATLNYPATGYGIRYEYGMFEQHIEDGFQVEYPDNWLKHRDPWSIKRSDLEVTVKFGGNVAYNQNEKNETVFSIENAEVVTATPFDTPIIGYDTNTINTLRLWSASSPEGFDLQLFNDMHYNRAVEKQNSAENISRVLYPNDSGPSGKTLRLKQQYFFCSASLQDLIRKYIATYGTDFTDFAKYNIIQLNDTHPVVAIPELMRILLDEYHVSWDDAWKIATKTFAYTNHTILAEALEKWPIDIFQTLLPRIYQIVEEINRRFNLQLAATFPGDYVRQNRMSIIANGMIHMAWLAIHTGFSVNGVAALHTDLLRDEELSDWSELYPAKFNNKTNGVTQRRWLVSANPLLADFITKRIGHGWEKEFSLMKGLEKYQDDKKALKELVDIKHENKVAFAKWLKEAQGVDIDPNSIFDVQIKRLHEYKRQLLNVLHIIYLYNKIIEDPSFNPPARTFIFGAKAASGYRRAKSIIKLINSVADKINNDSRVNGKIKVVFVSNYRVSAAEKLFPAADVSEQISTAGLEASGTGNMKFMINGALTLGTLDGANIEIVEEAGNENAFIFGLTAQEILKIDADHSYNPQVYLQKNPELAKVLNQLIDGTFNSNTQLFRELYDSLVYGVDGQRPDVFYVLADFEAYCDAQERIAKAYTDENGWAKKTLINIANSGKFSSDRTIEDYVSDIWKLEKLNIK